MVRLGGSVLSSSVLSSAPTAVKNSNRRRAPSAVKRQKQQRFRVYYLLHQSGGAAELIRMQRQTIFFNVEKQAGAGNTMRPRNSPETNKQVWQVLHAGSSETVLPLETKGTC